MSFTPAQCRAARAMIGWSQDQLATASKVAKATIANFEAGTREPYPRTLKDIWEALEAAGVEFTNGGQQGVKFKRTDFILEDITTTGLRVRRIQDGHRYAFGIEDRRVSKEGALLGSAPLQYQKAARAFAETAARDLRFID
jgi:transcriptional regulator with XRE-family HTH domain